MTGQHIIDSFYMKWECTFPRLPYAAHLFDKKYIKWCRKQRAFFLNAMVWSIRPKIILETGTGPGFSSICMAKAQIDADIKGGIVYTIDDGSRANYYENFEENLKSNRLENVIQHFTGNSIDILPDLLPKIGSVDLLHIDGCHDYPVPMQEFDLIEPYLSEISYIFVHDYDLEGVYKSISEILQRDNSWEKFRFPTHSEMLILTKKRDWQPHSMRLK